jgi:parvulin-like peptidyl-prolyl isomerase
MSERKNKGHAHEDEKVEQRNRKHKLLEARDRERHRKLYTYTAIALGVAGLLVVAGLVFEFMIRPNTAVAKVGDVSISTTEFQKRIQLDRSNMQSQLIRLSNLEQQFGGQGFFTSQIQQLQATLASPLAIGAQTLDQMVNEIIVGQEAAARGITVSDAEVDQAIRDEVAGGQGFVTEPQATATAQANVNATATADAITPTPSPTVDVSATLTTTATAVITPTATPEPAPTTAVMTETTYTSGLATLEQNLREVAGMSLADYREVVRARLLQDKLEEAIGAEQVALTEEQIRARHILLRVRPEEPTPTPVPEGQPTPEPTATATALPEGAPTPTPTPGPRDDAATLALANELRTRLLAGEDFAALAEEYSDDGSSASGGDLGWFARGAMVAPFEEAAFALAVDEISEPVKTDFGYHLIQVLERDAERPKDEATLAQERSTTFQTWLEGQLASTTVERGNIFNALPRGF